MVEVAETWNLEAPPPVVDQRRFDRWSLRAQKIINGLVNNIVVGQWEATGGDLRPKVSGQDVVPNGTAELGLTTNRWYVVNADYHKIYEDVLFIPAGADSTNTMLFRNSTNTGTFGYIQFKNSTGLTMGVFDGDGYTKIVGKVASGAASNGAVKIVSRVNLGGASDKIAVFDNVDGTHKGYVKHDGSVGADSGIFEAIGANPIKLISNDANDASAEGLIVDTNNTFNVSGADLLSLRTGGADRHVITYDAENWKYDTIQTAMAQSGGLIIRSPNATALWDHTSGLTANGSTYNNLDLTSYVPFEANAVLFEVRVRDSTTGLFVGLRRDSSDRTRYAVTQTSGVNNYRHMIVPHDKGNRRVQCVISSGLSPFAIYILGYYL